VLHYVTWCWHIPRTTPAATAVFETTPVGTHLRGWRFGVLVLALTALIITLALIDYVAGRNAYTSLASYHAYLEYPILLLLLLGGARHRAGDRTLSLVEARPTASALPRTGDDPT
jgi:hypothetical protein